MLYALAIFAGGRPEPTCCPSQGELGRATCLTHKTVNAAVARLVALGLITSTPHTVPGGRVNLYRLNLDAIDLLPTSGIARPVHANKWHARRAKVA